MAKNEHAGSIIIIEMVIAAVTVVWVASFIADLLIPSYDASQINNIFLVIVGSGVLVRAAASTVPGGPKNGDTAATGASTPTPVPTPLVGNPPAKG